MFRSIFRPYGPVWNFFNAITDVLLLSLLWCLCSLPLITLGASTTALYDAAVHGIRYREPGLYSPPHFVNRNPRNFSLIFLFTVRYNRFNQKWQQVSL